MKNIFNLLYNCNNQVISLITIMALKEFKVSEKNVNLIRPGETYVGAQGVTYSAGVSRNTAGSEKVCMNVLPMAPGVHSIPHIHKEIETIAYLLEGECTLFHGEKLENQTLVKKGEQIFIGWIII